MVTDAGLAIPSLAEAAALAIRLVHAEGEVRPRDGMAASPTIGPEGSVADGQATALATDARVDPFT